MSHRSCLLLCLLMLETSGVALAQPSVDADADADALGISTEATSLVEPDVTTTDRLTGDQSFAAERLRVVPRPHADAWLTLSPGLVRANHGGLWHASSLYLRGFDAGEGQSFAASVEGIPLNEPSNAHGHGYLDVGLVIPEAIASVSIAQGPFRPEQGDFSIAGSAAYHLGPERTGAFGTIAAGSFRTYRLMSGWVDERADDASASFFVVDALRGDGFGPNRAHESVRINARLVHALDETRTVSLFYGSQLQRHDSAGLVRDDALLLGTLPCDEDVRAQFDCVVNPRQGGSAQRHLLSVTYDAAHLHATVHAGVRDVRFREDFTGEVLDARGDGVEARYETFTVGSTGAYTRALPVRAISVRAGWDARHDRGGTRMVRLRRTDGVPYDVVFDAGLALSRVGVFAAGTAHHIFPSGLILDAELSTRVEGFAATITHRDRPTTDRDGVRLPYDVTDSFGLAIQPRAAIAFETRHGFAMHLSSGVGARSNDAQALSDGERAPFTRVVASELGAAYTLRRAGHERLRADLALFHTVVLDDLVFDTNAVRNMPAGRTRRYGTTLALTYDDAFGEQDRHLLVARGSLGVADARFVEPGLSAIAFAPGAPVPFVPRATGRLDVAFASHFANGRARLEAGLGASVVGREPLPLGARGEAYATVDAGMGVGFRFVDVHIGVENIADTRYRSMELFHVADFGGRDGLPANNLLPTRLYAAGAPRTFMITLRLGAEP